MEPITSIMLNMFGKMYSILSYNVHFSQNYNTTTGKVSGEPVGDVLHLEIIGDGESDFVELMIDAVKGEEGKIEFYSGNKVIKSIVFEKACLVNYSQGIRKISDGDGNTETVLTENLAFSYRKLDFGDIDFEKKSKQKTAA